MVFFVSLWNKNNLIWSKTKNLLQTKQKEEKILFCFVCPCAWKWGEMDPTMLHFAWHKIFLKKNRLTLLQIAWEKEKTSLMASQSEWASASHVPLRALPLIYTQPEWSPSKSIHSKRGPSSSSLGSKRSINAPKACQMSLKWESFHDEDSNLNGKAGTVQLYMHWCAAEATFCCPTENSHHLKS
jgi:hypothetical protein